MEVGATFYDNVDLYITEGWVFQTLNEVLYRGGYVSQEIDTNWTSPIWISRWRRLKVRVGVSLMKNSWKQEKHMAINSVRQNM